MKSATAIPAIRRPTTTAAKEIATVLDMPRMVSSSLEDESAEVEGVDPPAALATVAAGEVAFEDVGALESSVPGQFRTAHRRARRSPAPPVCTAVVFELPPAPPSPDSSVSAPVVEVPSSPAGAAPAVVVAAPSPVFVV